MNFSTRQLSVIEELTLLPPHRKVFVSSEMGSKVLAEDRKTVVKAIEGPELGKGWYKAWYWERDAAAGPYSSEPLCVATAKTSDALVLIVTRKLTRVTLAEYYAAKSVGVPCFIMLKDGVRQTREVKNFIQEERSSGTTKKFKNLSELHSSVIESLGQYSAWSHRFRNILNRFGIDPFTIDIQALPIIHGSVGSGKSYFLKEQVIPVDLASPTEELIDDARKMAESGYPRGALELLGAGVATASSAGRPSIVLRLLSAVSELVPPESLEISDHAWLTHAEALARNFLGSPNQSLELLERVEEMGRQIGDLDIVSTAQQSLGAVKQQLGDLEEARISYRSALKTKLDIHDSQGVLQLFINLAAVAQDLAEFDESHRILMEAERHIQSLGDPHLLMSLHGNLGNLSVKRGEFAEAEGYYRRALRYARNSGDLSSVVLSLQNLGAVNLDQGNFAKAVRWYRKAVRVAEVVGALPQLTVVKTGLAMALYQSDRFAEAAVELEEVRQFLTQLDDHHERAVATSNLAAILIRLHETDKALALLTDALRTFEAIGDYEWQGRVHTNLFEAYLAAGDIEQSLQSIESTLIMLPTELNSERISMLRRGAEALLQSPSTIEKAAEYYHRYVAEARKVQDRESLAESFAYAGAALSQHGGDGLALPFYETALQMYLGIADRQMEFHVRNDRANSLTRLARFEEARAEYQLCMAIAKELDDRVKLSQAHMNSGEMERSAGNVDVSIRHHRDALSLVQELEDQVREGEVLANLGISLVQDERWDEAKQSFGKARKLGNLTRSPHIQSMAIGGLGSVKFAQGKFAAAVPHYLKAIEIEEAEGDRRNLIADLAAVIELFAALNDKERLEDYCQRLVTAAQRYAGEENACQGLARAGKRMLQRGDFETASEMYGIAIVLSIANGKLEESLETLGRFFILMIFQVRDVFEQDHSAFYSQVLSEVNALTSDAGFESTEFMEEVLDVARTAADDVEAKQYS